MSHNSNQNLAGGFAARAPAPLASRRHLRRFLYIATGIGLVMLLQTQRSNPAPVASRIPLYLGLIVVELVLARFVVVGIRAYGFKLIDLLAYRGRETFDVVIDFLTVVGTATLLRYLGPSLFRLLGRWTSQTGFLLPATLSESVVWVGVSLAAGICEELVYRGYLQSQLWSLTKSLPAALALQSVIFGFGHIYQGWKPALVTAIYGLVFGLVAAWRRSIVPGAIAHAIVDILGGLKVW
jgi:membrane protease YdiL (CAAX protease family)